MSIKTLRKQIDKLDKQLIIILAKRFQLVENIFVEKCKLGLPVRNIKREKEMLKKRILWLKKKGYSDSVFVKSLFGIIMKKSRKLKQ
ncbi:chorismate mutase [Candidatus Woesearchaeota archaeon]|nr:chorismate mutase [Candidatus Woesearchaeota archaeon]